MSAEPSLAERYELFIFDLDGVVYIGTHVVPGAAQALERLHRMERIVAYVTNNASRRASEVATLLVGLGIPAATDEVVTSAQATAAVLAKQWPAGSPVLVVGARALADDLAAAGLRPVSRADDEPVAVAQGYGPEVGWPLLAEASVAIYRGASWVATNTDHTLPSPRGPLPGNGALVAAVATTVGRPPDLVVGKPAPTLFEQTVQRYPGRRALVVGDRLDTDIEGAHRAGLDSLLVLTGVTRPADLLRAPPTQRPIYLASDLSGLFTVDDAVPVRKAAGGWRVERDGTALILAGAGNAVDALRALCAVAWEAGNSERPTVRARGPEAATALQELELTSFVT